MRKSLLKIGSAALAALMLGTSFVTVEAAPLRPEVPAVATTDVIQARSPRAEERAYWRMRHGNPYYNGHRGYRHWRDGYRRHRGYWFPGAAFATGVIIGGAVAQPRVRVRPGLSRAHVEYCMQRYRSYRAWDDTYQPNYGPRRRCIY